MNVYSWADGLREIFYKNIPCHRNGEIPAVETLILLILKVTPGKAPLYELDQSVQAIDLRCPGIREFEGVRFNDYRFGRGLEKLYFPRAQMTFFVEWIFRSKHSTMFVATGPDLLMIAIPGTRKGEPLGSPS